jgi:Gpi18-like mannosyltransferase
MEKYTYTYILYNILQHILYYRKRNTHWNDHLYLKEDPKVELIQNDRSLYLQKINENEWTDAYNKNILEKLKSLL